MSAAFSRSVQAMRAGHRRRSLAAIATAMVLLGGWLAWLFFARVSRYEVSEVARVEVGQTAHRIAAPVLGKVTAVHLALGAAVEVGDILVEIDDEPQRLERGEKEARYDAAAAQLAPLAREVAAHEQALAETLQAGRARIDESKAHGRESEGAARFQEAAAARAERLRREGLLSESEMERFTAEAQQKRLAAEGQERATERTDAEHRSRASELRAELAGLARQAAALEGEKAVLRAAIDGLVADIERRKVRAPIAGRIGEITVLRAGAFLKEGDPIAAVIPAGELRIVAEFPLSSVGRVRAGQTARTRLEAYPWTEYGTVPAVVESVGTEAQRAHVRVELTLQLPPSSPILLQHGLLGKVVVEVERVSPATLLLRAAGQLVRTRTGDVPAP